MLFGVRHGISAKRSFQNFVGGRVLHSALRAQQYLTLVTKICMHLTSQATILATRYSNTEHDDLPAISGLVSLFTTSNDS